MSTKGGEAVRIKGDNKGRERAALMFGPAGVPKKARRRDSEAGIERVKSVGLDCMELEFVRGVSMGEAKADSVKAVAENLGISLSVHAPYYINLNSDDSKIIKASKRRLFEAARIGALCGAKGVAFHPGYYMGASSASALRKVKKHLRELVKECRSEGIEICLRPETTGKPSQFGRLDEILALSETVDGVMPCVDFAHLHAYEGKANSYDEFSCVLETIRSRLGSDSLVDMHIHASGIHYGQKGELKHLNLAESDLKYVALLRALRDFNVGGCLICESPDREADALMLKKRYGRIRKKIRR
jgi:deoxyribonuclease-4